MEGVFFFLCLLAILWSESLPEKRMRGMLPPNAGLCVYK
jgi:hypothetical protein